MKYIHVNAGNGYCGCDEEFLMKFEDDMSDNDIWDEVLCNYSYIDGAAGLDPDDEEFEEYSYEECIGDNTGYKEISEEEYKQLLEEGIEER